MIERLVDWNLRHVTLFGLIVLHMPHAARHSWFCTIANLAPPTVDMGAPFSLSTRLRLIVIYLRSHILYSFLCLNVSHFIFTRQTAFISIQGAVCIRLEINDCILSVIARVPTPSLVEVL